MSKLETNQVDPATGTTLTLGTSGDTIAIPSGVTIANSGTATGFSANTPMFSAYINGNQSIANTTATTVAYNTEVFDTGSDFNNSTYKWTVPETAKYLMNVRMAFDSSAEFASYFSIVKDGVGDMFSVQMGHDEASDTITGSLVLSLTASEVYYVQAYQSSGGAVNLIGNHQNSEFSVFKLS
jgi:hypothetical protein|tara:strand:- start:77 stop:622 length:546 start_codon:yes stop_codon:yes gene_type:complete